MTYLKTCIKILILVFIYYLNCWICAHDVIHDLLEHDSPENMLISSWKNILDADVYENLADAITPKLNIKTDTLRPRYKVP